MTRRRLVFRATWGTCFALFLLPVLVPMPSGRSQLAAYVGLLLFAFGIIQVIRNELAEGGRLKALARGECPSCGYDLAGLPGDVCPECGESTTGAPR